MSFDLSDIPAPLIQLAADGVRALVKLIAPDGDDGAAERIMKATVKAAAEAALLEAQNRAAADRIEGDIEAVLVLVKAVEDALIPKSTLPKLGDMFEIEIDDPTKETP